MLTGICTPISTATDSRTPLVAGHSVAMTAHQQDSHRQLDTNQPDISQLSPELQEQWMHDWNQHLGSIVVKPFSRHTVWWMCPNCPDGHAHIWEARPDSRSRGSGCPFCSGKRACKHNSLAVNAHEVVCYWHYEKNLPLTPDTITAQSGHKAHWVCLACNHEWQAKIQTEVVANSGCSECVKAHSGRSKEGVRHKHPTFAEANHPLLSQWDHSLNEKEGNFPDNTSLRSHKRIWWLCTQCPKGCKHSWQAKAYSRTTQPRNCP